MNKLLIVSNRLPVKVTKVGNKTDITSGSGGLASAVGSVSQKMRARWIGYVGDGFDQATADAVEAKGFYPVEVPAATYENYYDHFSNRVLWPVLHGFDPYDDPAVYWDDYLAANRRFADKVAELVKPGDVIWVHDYHLFMLPQLLRDRGITNRIGFFLHTPFPAAAFFSDNPHGRQLLESLLLTDSLGVQTRRCLRRLEASLDRLGAHVDELTRKIRYRGRDIVAGAFPIGIDYGFFSRRPVLDALFYEQFGPRVETKTVLSLSRLDYTKGIPMQLEAVAQLAAKPELKGKFVFRLVVIPSRDAQPEYAELKHRIETKVKQINDDADGWEPVAYQYGSLDPEVLKATYRQADVMLVTPVADGMNLVAKEYLAANARGVLVLSREAGAAEQLSEAILVDPYDIGQIAAATEYGLTAKRSVQAVRRLRQSIKSQDVFHWAQDFLGTLLPSHR